jgi:tRNA_anti-like
VSAFKKYALVATLAIIAIAIIYGYKEFNRKPANLLNVKPQLSVSADSIIAAYENDEAKANAQFLGKTILVNGIVSEMNNQHDTLLNVIIGNDGLHNVSCLLDKEQLENYKKYSVGKPVYIKGICTGFLADVELNRCVIVSNMPK